MKDAPALWRIDRAPLDGAPLIINIPHAGTYLPPAIAEALTAEGLRLPDTDWHVDKLTAFAPAMGVTLMCANYSRIVVDLNRDPSGNPLYPGSTNTEICPIATFANAPLYQPGRVPAGAEIASRVERYWRPYHAQLSAEIARIKARHGYCVLLDVHSIVSAAPRFFAGRLPDLNLGTVDGNSCEPSLAEAVFRRLRAADGFTAVHNGRFKGGFITRHYGQPADNAHAMQLEIAQRCYMDEDAPAHYDVSPAAALVAILKTLAEQLATWHPPLGTKL